MVEPTHDSDEEVQDKSFLEEPVILDKFKAAAQISDGKQFNFYGAAVNFYKLYN